MWGNSIGMDLRREQQSENEKDVWEFSRVWIGGIWGGVRGVGRRRGQFDLSVDFRLIPSAFCNPHHIPTAARSSEAAESQIINQKKYTSAHSENPSRASLGAYWVGFTRGERGGWLSLSMMCCLLSQHVHSRKEGKKSHCNVRSLVQEQKLTTTDIREMTAITQIQTSLRKMVSGSQVDWKAKTAKMFVRADERGNGEDAEVRPGVTLIWSAINFRPETGQSFS